jgi:hypothetical protein
VSRRWPSCAKPSGAPGKLRPESARAHRARRKCPSPTRGRPCTLLAALQTTASPGKVRVETARRASPVPITGLRKLLAALCRLPPATTRPEIGGSRQATAAAQRLDDALLSLALLVERLQHLAHVSRHGCGRMAPRSAAARAAAAVASRRRAFATAWAATTAASAHRTLSRVVVR